MSNPLTAVPIRAARWSALHPWRAILAWLAFVVVAVGLAVAIPVAETTDADYRLGESGRADTMIEAAGLQSPTTEYVLVTSPGDAALDEKDATSAGIALRADLAAVAGVDQVSEAQWNGDRSAMLIAVQLAKDHEETTQLTDVTAQVQEEYPGLQVREAGDLTLDESINDRVADDLSAAERISLPITLILMLLAFGALIAAGIPVLLAATSVAATIGLTAPLSHLVHSEPTVSSMIVLIGMAVGVDYSLFYLKREREERAAGRTTLDAVEIAAETSGHSILVSGGAVIASMAGLFVLGDTTFNSLASGGILVVAIAVLGSITVLPALLVKLGRWVDRPRVPLLWRLNRRIGRGGISSRVIAPVVRRPVAALVVSGVAVILLAGPALGMKMHTANLETLPASIPEVQTFNRIAQEFPVEGTSAQLVVRAAVSDQATVAESLAQVNEAAIASGDFVGSGRDPVQVSADGTTSVLELAMPYEESDPKVDAALRSLRGELAPAALEGLDAEYAVGGGAAESLDFVDLLRDRLPLVIGMVLLLTLLVMGLAFRSVAIALVSTVLNLVSVGVAFGVLTLVFQHGWFAGALDFTSPGFVIDWVPVFVMVVLVGLSMDYQVFVVSRIREHVRAGVPAPVAVRRGITDTAGVVTSAAAVMVSVFAIFATLSMMEMKMMGVGLAAAILIDATVIRLVMLPAILVLLGERAWWPVRSPRRDEAVEEEATYELAGR
ncbi:MMPL family transporter [Nocardioides sp. LHG3406-4]|uniref:MMPL family transporter n=1 Tax=Nocardioides sp. LHG3406-4 TaxID=2804575 RepID=UPI003CFA41F3